MFKGPKRPASARTREAIRTINVQVYRNHLGFCQIRKLFCACSFAESDNVLAVGLSGKFSAFSLREMKQEVEKQTHSFFFFFFCSTCSAKVEELNQILFSFSSDKDTSRGTDSRIRRSSSIFVGAEREENLIRNDRSRQHRVYGRETCSVDRTHDLYLLRILYRICKKQASIITKKRSTAKKKSNKGRVVEKN